MASQQSFQLWIDFKNKKDLEGRLQGALLWKINTVKVLWFVS